MSESADDLGPYFERFGPSYRWLVVVTTMLATVTVILSSTIVNVALVDIMGAFGIGQDKVQWVATAFLAAATAAMLLNAWMIRTVGVRMAFAAALALFAAGSLVGGLAPDENVLTAARVAQGTAAGIIQPLAMYMIFRVFPSDQRGRAMGIYGLGVVLAPALGPTVGGWLTESLEWRYVFFMGLPTSAAAFALALAFLPGRAALPREAAFDWTGMALLVLFLLSSLSALASGPREGWDSTLIVSLLSGAAALAALFVTWELRVSAPLLDLALFAHPRFAAAAVLAFLFGAGIFATTYLIPLLVQNVQGFGPIDAGAVLMPGGLMLAIAFPVSGWIADRRAPREPIVAGLVIFAASSALFYGADANTSFWTLAGWIVAGRVGLSLIMPALNAGAVSALPPALLGQATGTINFVRQLGGAFGVSLSAAALEQRFAFHADALAATQTAANPATMDLLGRIRALLSVQGLPETVQPAGALHYLDSVLSAQAGALAFADVFALIALVFVLGIAPAWLMRGHRPSAP